MVNPIVYSSAGAIMARFNISKDSVYFPAGKGKGDKVGGVSRLHTIQASNMSTIPLHYPQRAEMFHRPLGLWNPLVSKKLHVKNQSKLQSEQAPAESSFVLLSCAVCFDLCSVVLLCDATTESPVIDIEQWRCTHDQHAAQHDPQNMIPKA